MKRVSPFYILVMMSRLSFLLPLLPLQAVVFEGMAPYRAAYLYRGQIALGILIVVLCAYIRHRCLYSHKNGRISYVGGVLPRHREDCDFESFDSLCIGEGIHHRLMGICRIKCTSAACDTTLYLGKHSLSPLVQGFTHRDIPPAKCYRGTIIGTMLMSAGLSAVLTTLVAAVPYLRSVANAVGEKQALSLVDELSPRLLRGLYFLPPAIRLISTLILIMWSIGFVWGVFRHFCPEVSTDNGLIALSMGLLSRRRHILRRDRISTITINRSIFLSALKLCTVTLYIPRDSRQDTLTVSDACTAKNADTILAHIFPRCHHTPPSLTITANKNALWGYTYPAVTLLATTSILCVLSPSVPFDSPPYFFGIVTGVSAVWFYFRCYALFYSRIILCPNMLIVKTFRGLTLTENHIPKDKIRTIKISESVFQRRKGLCTLTIYLRGRHKSSIKIRQIDKEKTAQLLNPETVR